MIFPLLSSLLLEHCLRLDHNIDLILFSAADPIFLAFEVIGLLFILEDQKEAQRALVIM